ncbi:putative acid stress chaperone HdeA precursor [Caballeronia udeis]|jgi:acid stress chaperone HdeA|uniref:Putative acid stress chaperone HdeA n=1 Tax=Caballeronia udeis TaxID=1232866 RepID=A0A158I401_9BURK|nr:HdeA/HdeB family chaperone [Caballeronia udeis]SAL50750.1 putative acid stress chaperone HdeA precursor [Caballeronia udeis]
MKHLAIATAVLAGLCVSPLALAQAAKPVTPAKMSCSDFLAVDDAYKPALVYWVSGVDKLGVTETVTTVVDVATPVAMIVGECKQAPQAPFASKVRDLYKSGRIALFSHS